MMANVYSHRDYIWDEDQPPRSGGKNNIPREAMFGSRDILQQDLDFMRAEKDLSPISTYHSQRNDQFEAGNAEVFTDVKYVDLDDSQNRDSGGDFNPSSLQSRYSTQRNQNFSPGSRSYHSTASSPQYQTGYVSRHKPPAYASQQSIDKSSMFSRNLENMNNNLNRSVLSGRSQVELNRSTTHSILSHTLNRNQSLLSQKSILSQRSTGSVYLTKPMATNPDVSKSSLQKSFAYQPEPNAVVETENKPYKSICSMLCGFDNEHARNKHLANIFISLSLFCLMALVVFILSLQLIFRLTASDNTFKHSKNSLINSNISYQNTLEVAVALNSFVVMFDLACFLVCLIQLHLASKLLKYQDGEERALVFLKDSSPSRYVSTTGFFISIPLFILALILFIVLQYHSTSAIISIIIIFLGSLFIILGIAHSTYLWVLEKRKADEDFETDLERVVNKNGELLNKSQLSTLV